MTTRTGRRCRPLIMLGAISIVITPLGPAAVAAATAASPTPDQGSAPAATSVDDLAAPDASVVVPVPKSYIVVFDDVPSGEVEAKARALVRKHGGKITHLYTAALQGFAFRGRPKVAKKMATDSIVDYVEQDRSGSLDDGGKGARTGDTGVGPDFAGDQVTPAGLWGLDRIDQPAGTNGHYIYPNSGSGVRVYLLAGAIRSDHTEFSSRVFTGYDYVDGDFDAGYTTSCPSGGIPHTTKMAGTIGGSTYGVAKSVQIWAVRVGACDGTWTMTNVIDGVDWITENAVHPAVASFPWSMPIDPNDPISPPTALIDALTDSMASGVAYVGSGGNNAVDACKEVPAGVAGVLAVAPTDENDARLVTSNWGPCVDVFAPGHNVQTASSGSPTDWEYANGPNVASAHVVGVVARVLELEPDLTPTQVFDYIRTMAINDLVTGALGGAANELLDIQDRILDWGHPEAHSVWVDYDGDSRADYCRLVGDPAQPYPACTRTAFPRFGATGTSAAPMPCCPVTAKNAWIDIDGDAQKKADFCSWNPGTKISCSLSTGSGFTSVVQSQFTTTADHDGFADVWGGPGLEYCHATGPTSLACHQSIGGIFQTAPVVTATLPAGTSPLGSSDGYAWVNAGGGSQADYCTVEAYGASTVTCTVDLGLVSQLTFTSPALNLGDLSTWAWVNVTDPVSTPAGLADFCRAYAPTGTSTLECTPSIGTAFGAPKVAVNVDLGLPETRGWARHDADALADFCRTVVVGSSSTLQCLSAGLTIPDSSGQEIGCWRWDGCMWADVTADGRDDFARIGGDYNYVNTYGILTPTNPAGGFYGTAWI